MFLVAILVIVAVIIKVYCITLVVLQVVPWLVFYLRFEKISGYLQKIYQNLYLAQQLHQHHISIRSWTAVGVELPVKEEVEGVELPVGKEVEGVELPVGEEEESWLCLSISSINFFFNISCDFWSLSCLLESFVTCFDILFIFI